MAWYEALVDAFERTEPTDASRQECSFLAGWVVALMIGLVLTIVGLIVQLVNWQVGLVVLASSGLVHSMGLIILLVYAFYLRKQ